MGSGALFTNAAEAIFLVKPSYKDHWEIPGGAVEPGEGPRACCDRELLEELGLELRCGRLLVVDWRPATETQPDGLMFVFEGGRLEAAQLEDMRLQADELVDSKFVPADDLEAYLPDFMARRIRAAHACSSKGETRYLEAGFPSDQ